MRLLDRILGVDAQRAAPAGATPAWWTAFATPDAERILPSYRNNVDYYKNASVVHGVLAARVNLFSAAEVKFQNKADLSIYGSPALTLLEKPWPNGTTGELLARMEQDASLCGNAFIRRVNPQRLERLRPDWVTIISGVQVDPVSFTEYRELLGYWYAPPHDTGSGVMLPVSEVAHWTPTPDPDGSFCGISWMSAVLREVAADTSMTDYRRAYLENAATPNMLVRYSGKIGADKARMIAERIQARHGGVDNAFRTLVLDEGADVTPLGHNFEQMAFTAVQAAGENRIAVAAQVPAVIAGLKEGQDAANYSMYDAAMRKFADLTMRPLWASAFAQLEKLVECPPDSRLWFNEAGIAALRQGEKEQADTMFILAQAYQALIVAGVDSDTAKAALSAGDITLIKSIPGFVSVQMQKQAGASA